MKPTEARPPRPEPVPPAAPGTLVDTRGRLLRDLRISVTDRCNFRCTYCMPKEVFGKDFQFLEREQLLSFGEIHRLVRMFRDHGVEKIRITGGEPLVRRKLERLIEMLAYWDDLDLTLTTNGSLLKQKARDLRDAGLKRITVSLDSLDDTVFRAMNDVDFPVRESAGGHRGGRGRGLLPHQRSTWSSSAASTSTACCPWRAISRTAATSCASSSSWTWAPPTAGRWSTWCPLANWCR